MAAIAAPSHTGGMLPKDVDVLIVGAGHAGLAMSHFLSEAGREHVVIDRPRPRWAADGRTGGTNSGW